MKINEFRTSFLYCRNLNRCNLSTLNAKYHGTVTFYVCDLNVYIGLSLVFRHSFTIFFSEHFIIKKKINSLFY